MKRYSKSSVDLNELAVSCFMCILVCSLYMCGNQQLRWPSSAESVLGLDHMSVIYSESGIDHCALVTPNKPLLVQVYQEYWWV